MFKILEKIQRIRAAGSAIVWVPRESPLRNFNGKRYPLAKEHPIGTPGYHCRITLEINNKIVHLTLADVL